MNTNPPNETTITTFNQDDEEEIAVTAKQNAVTLLPSQASHCPVCAIVVCAASISATPSATHVLLLSDLLQCRPCGRINLLYGVFKEAVRGGGGNNDLVGVDN